jgi:hypothetical protein
MAKTNPALASLKKAFFDRGKVSRFLDAKTKRVLSKFGSFVRRRAQTSMRPDPKADKGGKPTYSPAGQPPRARGRKLLRKMLFFAYEQAAKTVYVGPLRLAATAQQHVPKTHEEGGVIVRRTRGGGQKHHRYKKRPFMKPAFDREIGWVAAEYRKKTGSL